MTVNIKRVDNAKSIPLRTLCCNEGFVDVETGYLYVRMGVGGDTPESTCRCLQFSPIMVVSYLDLDLEVYPANINIEWELTC